MPNVRGFSRLAGVLALVVAASGGLRAQTPSDAERKALASALSGAKVTLEQGLAAAAAKNGRPISAKFELEDGKLQLSVYTVQGSSYWEVIVDHVTGKVAKSEEIKEGDDLTNAKAQAEVTRSAKVSLRDAVAGAVKANAGSRAVSIFPQINDGSPSAEVALMRGEDRKVVTESLE